MNLQDVVWAIALVGMGLVALGFIFAIVQAGKPPKQDSAAKPAITAGRLQVGLFAALLLLFCVGSWATLRQYPIPAQRGVLDAQQVVDVIGRQWSWQIEPATVETGSVVEFRITSADVNHGFAVYAPDGHIVTQTQAMPGYTNKLLYTFTEPGTYLVRCLEYCGLAHAPMTAAIEVVAAGGD